MSLYPCLAVLVGVVIHLQYDVSTASPVAAVRATPGDILFSPEAQRPIASLARVYGNACFVYEFHLYLPLGVVVTSSVTVPTEKQYIKKSPVN